MRSRVVALGVQMVRSRRFLVQLRVGVVRRRKTQMAHGERTEVTSRRRDVHSARCDGAVNESTVQMRAALVRVGGVAVPMRDRVTAVCDARRRVDGALGQVSECVVQVSVRPGARRGMVVAVSVRGMRMIGGAVQPVGAMMQTTGALCRAGLPACAVECAVPWCK